MNERLNFGWPQRTTDSPDATPIDIAEELVVATDASAWFVVPEGYLRLPLDGEFRTTQTLATDPCALVDGALIPYRDIYLYNAAGFGWKLQIVPSNRPEGSQGIRTGTITRASIPAPGGAYSG